MSVSTYTTTKSGAVSVTVMEWIEKIFLSSVFAYFTYNMLSSSAGIGLALAIVVICSEAIPLVLLFIRRQAQAFTRNPSDWALGFAGSSIPLLAMPGTAGANIAPLALCVLLALSGLILQLSAKIFLGRSFGIIAANRGVKTSGVYMFVRHPMYAGYLLTHIAILLSGPNIWNLTVYGIALAVQLVRLGREEALLADDPAYREYAAAVRYRLIPGVY